MMNFFQKDIVKKKLIKKKNNINNNIMKKFKWKKLISLT